MNKLSIVTVLIMAAYIGWSQYALSSYRTKLATEQQRVYQIADLHEMVMEIFTKMDGRIDVNQLKQYRPGLKLTEIARKEALTGLKAGERLYTMTFPKLNPEQKKQLDRYFSGLVLNNYFYVKTKQQGEVVELFWDKP